jgi:hypothetical protein
MMPSLSTTMPDADPQPYSASVRTFHLRHSNVALASSAELCPRSDVRSWMKYPSFSLTLLGQDTARNPCQVLTCPAGPYGTDNLCRAERAGLSGSTSRMSVCGRLTIAVSITLSWISRNALRSFSRLLVSLRLEEQKGILTHDRQ